MPGKIASLMVFGFITVTSAGEALAIPVGPLTKPEPAPITSSSHVNARVGMGNSVQPCPARLLSSVNAWARPLQQIPN